MNKYFKHSIIMFFIYLIVLSIVKTFAGFETTVLVGICTVLRLLEEKND